MLFYGLESDLTPSITALAGKKQKIDVSLDQYDALKRVDCAEKVDLSTQFQYANDSVIGYVHTINVEGSLIDFDVDESYGQSFPDKLFRIDRLRRLLNQQGMCLYYTDEEHNILFIARGCILKSLSFNENESWTTQVPYTFQMESQELDFFNLGDKHKTGLFDTLDLDKTYSSGLVNPVNYKIKDFSDNISFTFEDDGFSDLFRLDPEVSTLVNYDNLAYRINYEINATGKNYYDKNNTLIPAWEQAKLFCHDRIYRKIKDMIELKNAQILGIDTSATQCEATDTLTDIYGTPTTNAIFDGINNNMTFKVYNEEITCDSSESNGTFGIRYTALVKRGASPHIHKINKTLDFDGNNGSKRYKLQGNIQGLVLGGLLRSTVVDPNGVERGLGSLYIPEKGHFLVHEDNDTEYDVNAKFDNAQKYFKSITSNVGVETDLSDAMKLSLGITHANLLLEAYPPVGTNCSSTLPENYPRASNFTVQKNWHEGSIAWTAEFDSSLACAGNHSSVEFSINRETPIMASYSIPNGSTITPMNPFGIGHRLVYIGTVTNPTIDITIKGMDTKYCCLGRDNGPQLLADFVAASNTWISLYPDIEARLPKIFPHPDANAVLTRNSKNLNINTGEYTINLSYTLCTPGCLITKGL